MNVSVSNDSMPPEDTGAIWVAIACKPWNVDPRRKQSLVDKEGAPEDKFLLNTKPPSYIYESICMNYEFIIIIFIK